MDGSKAYPTTPVLKLDVDKIAAISTGGPQGLSYMWTGKAKDPSNLFQYFALTSPGILSLQQVQGEHSRRSAIRESELETVV
jgi:hypothetical protein